MLCWTAYICLFWCSGRLPKTAFLDGQMKTTLGRVAPRHMGDTVQSGSGVRHGHGRSAGQAS